MLDNLDEFIEACRDHAGAFHLSEPDRFRAGDLYCPVCGGPRRVTVVVLYPRSSGGLYVAERSVEEIAKQIEPGLFVLQCLQCHTLFTALLFEGPRGYELAIFPAVAGGLATSHTPEGVAYYLDQAQRAQNVGANSAAVAMYRAALEQLLYEQGYTVRMLGPKIAALEQAIKEETAPRWARDLKSEYLTVIKKLGDAAIHPGEGDVGRQASLDSSLLRQLRITFGELLQVVYERDHEEAGRLNALREALSGVEPGTGQADSEQ